MSVSDQDRMIHRRTMKDRSRPLNAILGSFIISIMLSCTTLAPESHYNKAVDYAREGDLSMAEAEYRLAIEAKPDLLQARNNLGVLYLKQGRLAEAEHEFKAALSIKHDYLFALVNLASTYEAMGRNDQVALDAWKAALRLETRSGLKQRMTQKIAELEVLLSSPSGSPVLTLFSPTAGQVGSANRLQVEGEARSPDGIERVAVLVNGEPISEDIRGMDGIETDKFPVVHPFHFEQEVVLREGENEITVVATDRQGLTTRRAIKITRQPLHAGRFYEKSWGVVIGIDRYEHWPSLEYAVNDANNMAAKLRDMNFDVVIQVMEKEATRERILNLLGTELPERVGQNDRVFIFFAGHGQTEELSGGRQKGYLIPVDGSMTDYFTTAISMAQVREFADRIPAKHIYYAIDACYSGLGLMRAMGVRPDMANYLDKVTRMRAVQMVTAGGLGEQVVERGGHGLFTHYLLRGLDGEADLDNDGAVTATELGAFIRPQVSMASGNRQTPQYGRLDGEGEVVFIPPGR